MNNIVKIVLIGFFALMAIFIIDDAIKASNHKKDKEPCPAQAIDPNILKLAWTKGATSGIYLMQGGMLNHEFNYEETKSKYWQQDSIFIQNCIEHGH